MVVDGTTRLQNLEITGTVSGLTFSVDGQTIRPTSVETTQGVVVGTDLLVNGLSDLQNVHAEDLLLDGTLTVVGRTTLRGGFTTETGNGTIGGALDVQGTTTLVGDVSVSGATSMTSTLTVDGLITALAGLSVTGDISSNGNLTLTGDATLNSNGTGTTKVHNLEISGTVSGLTVDLSGQSISVASVNSFGNGSFGGNLTVSGDTSVNKLTASFVEFVGEDVASSTAAWSPSGLANVYNVVVDTALTINMWPNITDPDSPSPFQAVIYLWQDAVGHPVTFDGSYLMLNTETVNPAPNSVTIVNLSYCGRGAVVDTIVSRRP